MKKGHLGYFVTMCAMLLFASSEVYALCPAATLPGVWENKDKNTRSITNESLTVSAGQTGTYYVMVRAYRAYSGLVLSATY